MPPFYIGSSSIKRIKEKNYHGTVESFAYGQQWKHEKKNNPHLFETRIISTHSTRQEALDREHELQLKLGVVHNTLYINQALAYGCFGIMPKEAQEKRNKTINDPEWIETVGKPLREKISKARLDEEWKETVGKIAIQKYQQTINSDEYKNGNGKRKSEKLSRTANDPEWKATIGKQKYENLSRLKNSPEWRRTKGEEANRKRRETVNSEEWKNTKRNAWIEKIKEGRSDPEWKKSHQKTCEYCGKTCDSANYAKWHGNKCKNKPQIAATECDL